VPVSAGAIDNESGSEARANEVRQEVDRARSDLRYALERGEEDTAADVEAELRMRLCRVLRSRPGASAPLRLLVSRFLPVAPETGTGEEPDPQVGQGDPTFESSIPLSVFGIDRQDAGLPRYACWWRPAKKVRCTPQVAWKSSSLLRAGQSLRTDAGLRDPPAQADRQAVGTPRQGSHRAGAAAAQ
jgi:hypothetical protein